MRCLFYLILLFLVTLIVCDQCISRFKDVKRQALDKKAASQTAAKEKRQAPDFRQAALQTVAYLNDIPEVEGILLDPADNSILFIEFRSLPSDFELILQAAAVHLSNKKKELTGASGILVYGTQGGLDFGHAFWMVHARYGKIDKSESWQ